MGCGGPGPRPSPHSPTLPLLLLSPPPPSASFLPLGWGGVWLWHAPYPPVTVPRAAVGFGWGSQTFRAHVGGSSTWAASAPVPGSRLPGLPRAQALIVFNLSCCVPQPRLPGATLTDPHLLPPPGPRGASQLHPRSLTCSHSPSPHPPRPGSQALAPHRPRGLQGRLSRGRGGRGGSVVGLTLCLGRVPAPGPRLARRSPQRRQEAGPAALGVQFQCGGCLIIG